jgi:hypothetical protein
MGTAATERSVERPGDGASPGACAVDQIAPELPEERPPPAGVRAPLAALWWLSRTGKTNREVRTGAAYFDSPSFSCRLVGHIRNGHKEGGKKRVRLEGN